MTGSYTTHISNLEDIKCIHPTKESVYIEVWQFSDLSSPKSCKNDVSYITFQSYNIHNSPANRVINQADFVLSTYSKKMPQFRQCLISM